MSASLVALLGSGFRYSTDDAVTWSAQITFPGWSPGFIPCRAIAWNGSVFCVTSHGGRDTLTSPDGVTWTRHTNALPSVGNWDAIAWNGTVFCTLDATEYTDKAATSTDGITWTAQTIAPGGQWWRAITWNGSFFYAADTSGITKVCKSTDGATWTNVPLGATYANAHDIASLVNGTLCMVFRSGGSDITLVSTNNGGSWSSAASIGASTVIKIGSDGTNFVKVTGYTGCYTSTDGLAWTSRTFSTYQAVTCIGWNGSVFYTQAGNNGGNGNRSSDGVTWTSDSIAGTYYAIGAAFDLFAAPPLMPILPPFWKDAVNVAVR